ncbi:transglycosylase SLT domain-containing protein [Halomonas sp. Bachu 37]|uniref:transglycosylase SLT domain-containing protein n=1 Tax=Halomonas kashgarensis TaxID=3084920 RepID=UPI00321734B4
MTYRTLRQRLLITAAGAFLLGSVLVSASTTQASAIQRPGISSISATSFWSALELQQQDAWSALRETFQWQDEHRSLATRDQARVQKWIDHYLSNPENIVEIAERARPWLVWITQQIEARGLPGELALLPFIESSFDPAARSHRGAAGLWQFMPRTGDALGLVRNGNYDGRLDVVNSTRAALEYIELQAEQWYEGDIPLSLAAYNAGAGTVNRARRNAENQGLSATYWSLQLPNETMQYLPKLYAISAIINDPDRYQVELPDIHAEPAFAKVQLKQAVSLTDASRILNVHKRDLAKLNPGLLNGVVEPRTARTLLVPDDVDTSRLASLTQVAEVDTTRNMGDTTHVVQRGDSLSAIAARYNVSQRDLARWNALEQPGALQPGQLLTLSER